MAVVGIGHAGFAPITAGLSYKELMFEAAQRAYADAEVDPRADVDSFVCCSEDYLEGTSIFDEYVPDQLGAVQRPVQTVAADGLFGVATALMLIRSGAARVVAVEAHSKVSDVLTLGAIEQFAMDPVFNRPLAVPALAVAGLDMNAFLERTGLTEEHCAMVAAKNRTNALDNPRAAYPADIAAEDVEGSAPVYWPLRELEVAARADGCVVVVLAAEERAGDLTEGPVWLLGAGWSSGSPRSRAATGARPISSRGRRSAPTRWRAWRIRGRRSTSPRWMTSMRSRSSSTSRPWGSDQPTSWPRCWPRGSSRRMATFR